MNEQEALQYAIGVATDSPCGKSQRGVVIFHRDKPVVVSEGFNAPPQPFACDGSEACRAACNKVAVHAEEIALLAALRIGARVAGCEMLHVRVKDGQAVPSGGPSCWQCSRHILEAGISRMWLLHEDGLKSYDPTEFHRLTLVECGLHVGLPREEFISPQPLVQEREGSMSVSQILCIDDDPSRYERFWVVAQRRGNVVTITDRMKIVEYTLDYPHPNGRLAGICLDYQMPLDATEFIREYKETLATRQVPVAIVTNHHQGAVDLHTLLTQAGVPARILPCKGTTEWSDRVLDFFESVSGKADAT